MSQGGEMTGCENAHVICGDCLRFSLRTLAGDILVTRNLVCGCLDKSSNRTILELADRADTNLRAALATSPSDPIEKMQLDMELEETCRRFGLTEAVNLSLEGLGQYIPPNLYRMKTEAWFDRLMRDELAPLYHVCTHPLCATQVENWILRSDFNAYQSRTNRHTWTCPLGHTNTVLPSEAELREVNRNILMHPEYYTEDTAYDHCPLRRYRVCPGCVGEGSMLMAAHGEGCKQWPGSSSAHHHQFCFCCTRPWGRGEGECGHGRATCVDPGIQQVRRNGDKLEIGFVSAPQYLEWLNGVRAQPPPTVFRTGNFIDKFRVSRTVPVESGPDRQRDLGLEDRSFLLEESRGGTQ